MRHKSTVIAMDTHIQFDKKGAVKDKQQTKASNWKKDQKEGQSDYRVAKVIRKK